MTTPLPPFSLICDFGKQNTRRNVSKISVSLTCYWHIGSKSSNHSPLAWHREGQKVTLVAVIGGFRSDLSITRFPKSRINENSANTLLLQPLYFATPIPPKKLSQSFSFLYNPFNTATPLRWLNTVFMHAFVDVIQYAHKECKKILSIEHIHYLCYFSLWLNAVICLKR